MELIIRVLVIVMVEMMVLVKVAVVVMAIPMVMMIMTMTMMMMQNVFTCTCAIEFYHCILLVCYYHDSVSLQESLLDRQEFLQWLLDLLDKSKNADDLLLKFLIPLLLRVLYNVLYVGQTE